MHSSIVLKITKNFFLLNLNGKHASIHFFHSESLNSSRKELFFIHENAISTFFVESFHVCRLHTFFTFNLI